MLLVILVSLVWDFVWDVGSFGFGVFGLFGFFVLFVILLSLVLDFVWDFVCFLVVVSLFCLVSVGFWYDGFGSHRYLCVRLANAGAVFQPQTHSEELRCSMLLDSRCCWMQHSEYVAVLSVWSLTPRSSRCARTGCSGVWFLNLQIRVQDARTTSCMNLHMFLCL